MTNVHSILLVLFLTHFCVSVALSSDESPDHNATYQQSSSDGSKQPGYLLVTPPSVNKKKIESMLKKIRSDVPRAEIRKKIEERVLYRLVTQCFDSLPLAEKKRADLFKSSRTPFIVKSDNSFCVVASSQMTIKGAFAEQKQLAEKHVKANIVKLSLPLALWQVKSSDVYDLRNAVRMANAVSVKGLITTIEPFETDH